MKRLWHMFTMALLFPIFPGIGIPDGEGDGENDGEGEAATATRKMEELSVTIKSIADNFEGLPETVRGEVDRRIKEMDKDVKAFKEERDTKVAALEARLNAALEKQAAPPLGGGTETEEDYGYGNELGGFDEMIAEVRACGAGGMGTPGRLMKMHKGEIERRGLSTLTGLGGGFWMRPQFSELLLQIPPDEQYLSTMIRNLPATDPPNAEFTFNAFDQSGSKGIFGGVAVYSAKELADLSETEYPTLLKVTFKPEKTGVFWTVSEESQANTPQMGAMMQPLINGAILAQRDDKIQTGTGAGEFKGFASSPAMITVARSVADQVNFIDLVNMIARQMTGGGGKFVWACQRVTMLPQLMTLTDGSGKLIWADNAREGIPAPTLAGIPIFFNQISPTLGTQGDLRLINLDYYMRKPGMGATLKSDMGILGFKKGEETLKVSYYDDAKPWITAPLTLRDGINTVSPFIELTAVE